MRKDRLGLQSLAGSILLAHPDLEDPNFFRSVVLISAHAEESGVIGVIINRPTDKTLSDIANELPDPILADIPVYEGGPVHKDQIILTAWKWIHEESMFKLYFGLTLERARELLQEENIEVRAFSGYSGWDAGQLEDEIAEGAWVVSTLRGKPISHMSGNDDLWRTLLIAAAPEMLIILDSPEDPSLN
jgi:putative transcriptional regulator